MRKVILLEHDSLDGHLAGPQGEMDWINTDDEVWHYLHPLLDGADTVIWGLLTYKMMEEYWPTAPDRPDATQHDVHHGLWLRNAIKIVLSKSLHNPPGPTPEWFKEIQAM
jgi:hypothetical protein